MRKYNNDITGVKHYKILLTSVEVDSLMSESTFFPNSPASVL